MPPAISRGAARASRYSVGSSTRRGHRLVGIGQRELDLRVLLREAPEVAQQGVQNVHLRDCGSSCMSSETMRISSGRRGSGTVQPATRQAASSARAKLRQHDRSFGANAIELRAKGAKGDQR